MPWGVWGSVCTDPHFLDHSTSWIWVGFHTPATLTPRERGPTTHWIEGWVDTVWPLWTDNSWPYQYFSNPSVIQLILMHVKHPNWNFIFSKISGTSLNRSKTGILYTQLFLQIRTAINMYMHIIYHYLLLGSTPLGEAFDV